jgi:hypothetical protein
MKQLLLISYNVNSVAFYNALQKHPHSGNNSF